MLASPRTRMVRSGKEPATQTGECRLPSSAAAKRAAPRSPHARGAFTAKRLADQQRRRHEAAAAAVAVAEEAAVAAATDAAAEAQLTTAPYPSDFRRRGVGVMPDASSCRGSHVCTGTARAWFQAWTSLLRLQILQQKREFLRERERWFREHGDGSELPGTTRCEQNNLFQRLKDRLFALRASAVIVRTRPAHRARCERVECNAAQCEPFHVE